MLLPSLCLYLSTVLCYYTLLCFFFKNILCFNQSFKTRTGPAGWPGTRPTRAWDRSGWRQKPAWELARRNPVDPGPGPLGQPGWDRSIFFILIVIKRRRFDILKGQNTEEWRRTKQYQLQFTNLINSTLWNPTEEQRSKRRLDYWSLLFLCEKGLNLLLSLFIFFILGCWNNLFSNMELSTIIAKHHQSVTLFPSQFIEQLNCMPCLFLI